MYNGFEQSGDAATTTEVPYQGLTFTTPPKEGTNRTVYVLDQLRGRVINQGNCPNFEVSYSNKVLYIDEG
jgi:hypothetical protein